jgi:hypothetical protein
MARYSNPTSQYSDINGVPLPGNQLFFYETGTTTFKNTFSDAGLTTANTNPVVSDASGRIPDIFLDGTYKVVLKDTDDVTIWTRDPLGDTTAGQFTAWLNDVTYNIPEIVLGSDDDYYRSLTDANQGNDPTSSAANWEQLEFGRIWNTNVTYALGDEAIGSDGMLYFSLIAANSANNPTLEALDVNWRAADQLRYADGGGTVDAITATYIPSIAVLKDGLILRLRASGANATTTPTFAPNGLTAKTIVKNGNQALSTSDIFGADHELLLVYNSDNDNWELLNPAGSITLGVAVASTSGATIDFTGIPSGAKKITVIFSGVSTSGGSDIIFQLGDAGGFEITGYLGSSSALSTGTVSTAYTTGFGISSTSAGAAIIHGSISLTLFDPAAFTWASSGVFGQSNIGATMTSGGAKSLSAELTQIRVTTVGGTETFDAGKINIQYEF